MTSLFHTYVPSAKRMQSAIAITRNTPAFPVAVVCESYKGWLGRDGELRTHSHAGMVKAMGLGEQTFDNAPTFKVDSRLHSYLLLIPSHNLVAEAFEFTISDP